MTNTSNYVQSDCLEASGAMGFKFLYTFDAEPAEVRALIRSSKYNLCPACLLQKSQSISGQWHPSPQHWKAAIELMEYQIFCQDRQKPGFVPPLPPMRHFVAAPT
jgi:hypothetical protein